MTKSVDHIAEQLFKVLTGTGVGGSSNKLVLFTDDGKKTTNPTEARRFYLKNIQMMVNYVVDETTNEIVVNLSKDTDIKGVKSLLSSIRNLANRHIIEYTVKTFGKSIEPRDFAYMAKNKVQESSQLNARQLTVLTDIVNKYIMAPGSETRRAFYALKKQGLIEPFVKDGKVRKGYIATDAGKDLVTTHSKVQEGVAGTVSKSKIGWFATNLNGKLKSFRNEEQARSFASTGKSRETRDKEAMVKNESAYTNAPAEMKVSYDYSDDFYMLRLYVNGELVGEDDGYPGMNGTLTAPIEELAAKHGVDIEELVLVATDDNLQPEGEIGKLVNGKISWNVKEESAYDTAMNEVERINELTPKQKAMKQGAITTDYDATGTGSGRYAAQTVKKAPTPSGIRKLAKANMTPSQQRALAMLGKTKKKGAEADEIDQAFRAGSDQADWTANRRRSKEADPSTQRLKKGYPCVIAGRGYTGYNFRGEKLTKNKNGKPQPCLPQCLRYYI